ncbi:MAG: Flp pilus assembly protein TadD [Yoonia sp.]|jgi:Flp pilus assembly protein TadD
MRQSLLLTLFAAAIGISACEKSGEAQVEDVFEDLNVVDESNLSDVMLTVGDPNQAVAYFADASGKNPDRIDLKRGLALSLIRAQRPTDAVTAWQAVVVHEEANQSDSVNLADAYVRSNEWDAAAAALNTIPPTYETFKRYRLEAMVADSRQQWSKADSFYETAVGLTTRPATVYNNWGYSKLTRGDYPAAERLFIDALRFDSSMFTAKNNLVLARGAQRKYTLPVVPMTQTERAQLMHTMALTAIKQNDVSIGKSLLNDAIDTHPQFFEAAVRALEALENSV